MRAIGPQRGGRFQSRSLCRAALAHTMMFKSCAAFLNATEQP
jgi:hypothetical protein